ncbi:hypothetical protein C8R43DRAFT_1029009 [Mycena crocata]|nr:hypothetical protein C8R43DRAFT_1029009 [Mycena crocata]
MSASDLRAQHSALLSDIARQNLLLKNMHTRLEDIQQQLDSIHYPVLTLPPEITSEIFIHTLSDSCSYNADGNPVVLTHVCSTWRQIALSLPPLWNTLNIEVNHFHSFADTVKTWLKRARHFPLNVKIRGSLSSIKNFGSLMKTFRRHSGEIQFLELDICADDFEKMDRHKETQDLKFPILQKLSVRILEKEEDLDDYAALQMFRNAPLLHEVRMGEAPPSHIVLPWEQLTNFTGGMYTRTECWEALHLMPNLTKCALSVLELQLEDFDDHHAPLSHSKIQHLTLSSPGSHDDWACATDVLAFLTLPDLHILEILDVDLDEEDFESFSRRSTSQLRKFLWRPPRQDGTEISFTSFSPMLALTNLELWHPNDTLMYLFFDRFGWDSGLLPQLVHLSFLGLREMDNEASALDILTMARGTIDARRNIVEGCARLQSFRVVSEVFFSILEEYLSLFRKLKAEGMDVYIGTKTISFI